MGSDPWSRYDGKRGGSGWKNSQTGEIRYQEEKPTDRGVGEEHQTNQGQGQFQQLKIPDGFAESIKYIGSVIPHPEDQKELDEVKEKANIAVRLAMAVNQEKDLIDNMETQLDQHWEKVTPDTSPETKEIFLKAANLLYERTKAFIQKHQEITGNDTSDLDKAIPLLKKSGASLKKMFLIWNKFDQIKTSLEELKSNPPIDISEKRWMYAENWPDEYKQGMPEEPEWNEEEIYEPDEPDKPEPEDYSSEEYFQEDLEQYQQDVEQYKKDLKEYQDYQSRYEQYENDHDKWESDFERWEEKATKKLERQRAVWERQTEMLEDRLWNAGNQLGTWSDTFENSVQEAVIEILKEFEYTHSSVIDYAESELNDAYDFAGEIAENAQQQDDDR